MNAVLDAITAAGVVYDRHDFADPHLSGPTALTVTADGRVFGHLATWGTCHIGYGGQCVQPPSSSTGYKYFHQGVVTTADGDLPVGTLTLGTGHAPISRDIDANTAAAHYDNTGTGVAAVRAGEDAHGIWLSGRLVPGTPQDRIDELRRAGVSGDWRTINGTMELVAALAVNVPGFPVPRTEQLVAAGGVGALVAAGVVVPPDPTQMPQTPAELEAFVAAAADRRTRAVLARARLSEVADQARSQRRARGGGGPGAGGAAAGAGRGGGGARGGGGGGSAAGERRAKTEAGAKRYGVSVGDLIRADLTKVKARLDRAGKDAGRAADDVRERAGQYAEAAGRDVAKAVAGPKPGGSGEDKPKAAAKAEVVDTDTPTRTAGEPGDRLDEDQLPAKGAGGGKIVDYANGKALYDDGTMTDGAKWYRVADDVVARAKAQKAARRVKARTAAAIGAVIASASVVVSTAREAALHGRPVGSLILVGPVDLSAAGIDMDALVAAVRRVRTPAGAKKYGLPIGSPIVAKGHPKGKGHGKPLNMSSYEDHELVELLSNSHVHAKNDAAYDAALAELSKRKGANSEIGKAVAAHKKIKDAHDADVIAHGNPKDGVHPTPALKKSAAEVDASKRVIEDLVQQKAPAKAVPAKKAPTKKAPAPAAKNAPAKKVAPAKAAPSAALDEAKTQKAFEDAKAAHGQAINDQQIAQDHHTDMVHEEDQAWSAQGKAASAVKKAKQATAAAMNKQGTNSAGYKAAKAKEAAAVKELVNAEASLSAAMKDKEQAAANLKAANQKLSAAKKAHDDATRALAAPTPAAKRAAAKKADDEYLDAAKAHEAAVADRDALFKPYIDAFKTGSKASPDEKAALKAAYRAAFKNAEAAEVEMRQRKAAAHVAEGDMRGVTTFGSDAEAREHFYAQQGGRKGKPADIAGEFAVYSTDSGYQSVNAALRATDGDASKIRDPLVVKSHDGHTFSYSNKQYQERIKQLDQGFDDAPPLADSVFLSRGTRWHEFSQLGITGPNDDLSHLVGAKWTNHAYTSTSTSADAAMNTSDFPVQIRIMAPAGTKTVYMAGDVNHQDPLSTLPSEEESLLPRNATFQITRIRKVNGVWEVDADYLP